MSVGTEPVRPRSEIARCGAVGRVSRKPSPLLRWVHEGSGRGEAAWGNSAARPDPVTPWPLGDTPFTPSREGGAVGGGNAVPRNPDERAIVPSPMFHHPTAFRRGRCSRWGSAL